MVEIKQPTGTYAERIECNSFTDLSGCDAIACSINHEAESVLVNNAASTKELGAVLA